MRRLALLGVAIVMACKDATAPSMPPGELWEPPGVDTLWAQVVACSELAMPSADRTPRFYLSIGEFVEYTKDGEVFSAFGLTYVDLNRIYIARAVVREGGWERSVRHEMLHELLFENPPHVTSGHPSEYFTDKCGDLT